MTEVFGPKPRLESRGPSAMALPRGVLLGLAVLQVALFAGVVFGWPALRRVLEADGALQARSHAQPPVARQRQQRRVVVGPPRRAKVE